MYSKFAELFNRHATDSLPPHRLGVDYEIKLKDGAILLNKRLYLMSDLENQVVKKWIDEQLGKRAIRSSNSPTAAPVLIVRRPGGGLRVCLNYRGLNALTVKSRYPIPLM